MRSRALRYLGALAFTGAAGAVQLTFPRVFAATPFFLFWVAIFLSATFCGFSAAVLATLVSSGIVASALLAPPQTIVVAPIGIPQLVLFLFIGIAMSWTITAQRRGERRQSRDAERQLAQIRAVEEQRAQLAADMERQRERLSSIISNIPGVVWEAWGEPDQASQHIDFVSDHVTRMLGYTVEEWLSTPNFWLTIVHPDDRAQAAQNARAHFRRGGYGTNTFRWMTKDGRALWVESHSTIVRDGDARPLGMRGVTLDITARKRAEDALRVLAELSESLASTLDYEKSMPPVAEMVAKYFEGWCAVSFMGGESEPRRIALAHFDPAKREAAQKLLAVAPKRNLPQKIIESINLREPTILNAIDDHFIDASGRDGEDAALIRQLGLGSMIVAPMVAREKLIGALSIMSAKQGRFDASDAELADLIARRAAVAIDNAQLYRAAVEASNAKDEFLATVSHELRTPMTATLGWVRMLNLGHFDEETQKTALESIERSTRAQAKLIEDILDVSSIILGKFRLESVPVELMTVVNAAIDTLRPALAAKSMTLDVDTSRWHGVVQGDPNRLQQVVWNLVSNAIKFGRREGRIDVAVERIEEHARITVRDDGAGIDPEFLPHVFDRFRQGESGATRSHGGLGLGLAIVRHLVELHGGTVAVTSEGRGKGATFTVELPLAVDRERSEKSVETPLPDLAARNILIVDDERPTLELFSAVLRRCGARVATAQSVDEALVVLNMSHQDLVVTEIAMPGTDGVALLHAIRERDIGGTRTPTIGLTALSDLPVGDFDHMMRKPIDPIDLAFEVARVVSFHHPT
jgi:PAS domain S-box-containing protein